MALRVEPNAEPIPGYRLIERLGSGGFGEVWKAEAPGGLFKAIKFVQRDHTQEDEACAVGDPQDRSRADQEWKSLVRVKSVRHPFILLLDRFENIDNFLVIVMELADRTLADRFKECRTHGTAGIPRAELLSYMSEAAEVLDLMNTQYQLQHLDIKPQNLFLVHNHIKVADFGLVKDTTAGLKLMTITGGVTPVYAAPETFDGKFSRQCDQFSLAIVFQEMLTGHRPFTGTSMKQLILQHMQNSYDLKPLPVNDRAIIARALSKNPEDRFASCVEFIQRLTQATVGVEPPGVAKAAPPPPPPAGDKQFPSADRTLGARGIAGKVKPVDPDFSVEKAFLGGIGKAAPKLVPISPGDAADRPAQVSEPVGISSHTSVGAHRRAGHQVLPTAHELPGIVQPALLIGLGELGVNTLAQVRARVATELGSADVLPQVRLLAIDVDSATLQNATTGNPRTALRMQDTLLAKLQRPSYYLKAHEGKMPTDSWLCPKLLYRIPREQNGAGLRPLGRLAFVDNYRAIARRVEAELRACSSQDTPLDSNPYCDLGLRSTRPRVYIVAALTGNSGSGMLLDTAYLVRKLLNEQGHPDAEIVGLFFLPAMSREPVAAPALCNAYAALMELQHYCQNDAAFSALYETGASATKGERVLETGPAFQRCFLFTLPVSTIKRNPTDHAAVAASAGDFLYRDIATVLGQALDVQRMGKARAAIRPATLLESIGLYRVFWPRHALITQCSRRLCTQVVNRWMSKDARGMAETIGQWTQERWESLGMRPENLIERFQQLAEQSLASTPEQLLAETLGPLQQAMAEVPAEAGKQKAALKMTPVVECMASLEKLLGIPEEARAAKQLQATEPAALEATLADIAQVIADDSEQKLAELAVTLLEDPNYRLAGAEEALRQFCLTVEQSLQAQEILGKELTEKTIQLNQRIGQLIDAPLQAQPNSNTHWMLGLARRSSSAPAPPTPTDIFELVRTYAKTRYHSLVLGHLNRLYLALRGHLSDQIREVGFCRQRLSELLTMVAPTAAPELKGTSAGERTLFPPDCTDYKAALDQIGQGLTAEDLVLLDERVQAWIRTHCQALLEICMGSATLVKNLAPAMLLEAEAFVRARLQGTSVAEMYLTHHQRKFNENADDMIQDDLRRCLDEAIPPIGKLKEKNETSIVSFPDDDHGRKLQQILKKRAEGARVLLSERQDEIVFFQSIANIPWHELEQMGSIAREAYRQRLAADPAALHSREDVPEWQSAVLSSH